MTADAPEPAPPCRILLVGPGTSPHLWQWAGQLTGPGREVHVATVHPWTGPDPAGFRVHEFPGPSTLGYVLAAPWLRRLATSVDADVVHAHYATGYGLLARLARVRPLVVSVWGSDVFDFPDRSALHRRFLLANLEAAGRVCSTSEVMAQRLERLGQQRSRISVVPFGVDTGRFVARAPSPRARLVVGTVKSLETIYGIDVLIEAFALAVSRLEQLDVRSAELARLVVVGEGSRRAELEHLATRLGVAARTRFVGAVPHDDVPEWLGEMDIFVALSRRESFGVSVVEASAAGLPVLATAVDGLPEVVEDGVTGYLVPPDDAISASEALVRLMMDSGLRERLGLAGVELIGSRFAWPRCVERQLDAYAQALGARSDMLGPGGAL